LQGKENTRLNLCSPSNGPAPNSCIQNPPAPPSLWPTTPATTLAAHNTENFSSQAHTSSPFHTRRLDSTPTHQALTITMLPAIRSSSTSTGNILTQMLSSLNCYLCQDQGITSPLHHTRMNFSKNKTLFPVWGKSGRPILSVVMIYQCQCCKASSNMGKQWTLVGTIAHSPYKYLPCSSCLCTWGIPSSP
jgi:hypothetical protein